MKRMKLEPVYFAILASLAIALICIMAGWGLENRAPAGETQRSGWFVPASASSNSSALTADSAKAATLTKPATDTSAGRFVVGDVDVVNRILVEVAFALTDADNETASAAIWGWSRTNGGVWMPKLLCTVDFTAGSRTGVSGGDVSDSLRFADTITVNTDNTTRTVKTSGADNGIETIEIDHRGSDRIEIEVTTSGGTAASVLPIIRGF